MLELVGLTLAEARVERVARAMGTSNLNEACDFIILIVRHWSPELHLFMRDFATTS